MRALEDTRLSIDKMQPSASLADHHFVIRLGHPYRRTVNKVVFTIFVSNGTKAITKLNKEEDTNEADDNDHWSC
jgi:hypothetical protein